MSLYIPEMICSSARNHGTLVITVEAHVSMPGVRSVIGARLDMVAEKTQTPIFTVLTLLDWA
jgi:hypothetical protein